MTVETQAPEFPLELEWVNTAKAPVLSDLRGRVVLLHFFNAASINSVHTARDIKHLSSKYHDGLNVLGIHLPKFSAERDNATVLKAVNRAYLHYPVANDSGFRMWQLFGIEAWPSIAVLDTQGRLIEVLIGAGLRSELDELIQRLLDEAASKDQRLYQSVDRVSRPEAKATLRFPAKILATDTRLYVADTGNNRVMETTHSGRLVRQFGSANQGFLDGRYGEAAFDEPRGLAIIGDQLYIADSGNHALRRVHLITGEVDTIAGNGQLGWSPEFAQDQPKQAALNSPLDIVATPNGDGLLIAMAGWNQIWQLNLATNQMTLLAGSGKLDLQDGAAHLASFARPSAISVNAQTAFVADADSSSIRSISLQSGHVETLVGSGVYDFGDADGLANKAQLQFPQGLCADPKAPVIWVMDSYNNKIKAVSQRGAGVRTVKLTYDFVQPTGVSMANGKLWIANSGAHEIVQIETATGKAQRVAVGE